MKAFVNHGLALYKSDYLINDSSEILKQKRYDIPNY